MISAAISSASGSPAPAICAAPRSRPRIAPRAARPCAWISRWNACTAGMPVASRKYIRLAYGCVST